MTATYESAEILASCPSDGGVLFESKLQRVRAPREALARPRLTDFREDIPPQIDQWVARALALRRDDRYPYVTSMWNDLIRICQMANTTSGEKARQAFRLP